MGAFTVKLRQSDIAAEIRRLKRKMQRKAKPHVQDVANLDVLDSSATNSIKDLIDIGRATILSRYIEFLKTGKDAYLLRVDFVFIHEISTWFSYDSSTLEGRSVVDFLKRSIGCPKPFIDGTTVISHVWLQYDLTGLASSELGIYDDEHNLGRVYSGPDTPDEPDEEDIEPFDDLDDYIEEESFYPNGSGSVREGSPEVGTVDLNSDPSPREGIPVPEEPEVSTGLCLADDEGSGRDSGGSAWEQNQGSHFSEGSSSGHREAEPSHCM